MAAALMDSLNKKEKEQENNNNIAVFGIPRGGVLTADIIAKKLSAKYFDIVIPRKLTDIDNKEQAIGAIMEDGTTYLDQEIIEKLSIPSDYIEKEKQLLDHLLSFQKNPDQIALPQLQKRHCLLNLY